MPVSPVTLPPALRAQLQEVNDRVNGGTRYRCDLDLYGRPELWRAAEGQGDCEDYAIRKLRELVLLGWPRAALRLACCWVEAAAGGGYHAVLTVDTSAGTLVLDNRRARIDDWRDLPYRWDRREAPGGGAWVQIGGAA